jgi:glycosyltransferase involved in cell wall biosynthesis
MATVTVVLSNYNHARYLPDSLGHIARQTRAADQIVVVDDGSTDDSLRVIRAFAEANPFVEIVENGRNFGLQESVARALSIAEGDYLVWTAADDRLLPTFIERTMAVLERHPSAALGFSETSVLLGDTERIERFAADASVRHIFDLGDLPEFMTPARIKARMKRAYLPIASNTTLVRTDLLRSIGGYPRALEWHSDWFVGYALAIRHGACVVPDTLAVIRSSAASYSSGARDEARQRRVLCAMLDLLAGSVFRDVRRCFRACPSVLSPFGILMLDVLRHRPRDYDLLAPYAWWKVREYKRGHRLDWVQTVRQLALRAIGRWA